MDLKKLGTIIRNKREEIGIPPSILAEKTGIRRPTLWIYERGENPKTSKPSRPSKDKLERLAAVLHMSQAETEELLSLADYHITRQPSQASNHISAATKTDTTQRPSSPAPTITEINGTVYYAHDGYLEAFDARTGNRLWSSPTVVPPRELQPPERQEKATPFTDIIEELRQAELATDVVQYLHITEEADEVINNKAYEEAKKEQELFVKHKEEMEFLNYLGKRLIAATDRFDVLRALLLALHTTYSLSAFCILLKSDPVELFINPCLPLSASFIQEMLEQIVEAADVIGIPPITGEQLAETAKFYVPEEVAQHQTQEAVECTEVRSTLNFPLTVENRIVGMLTLFDERIGTFDTDTGKLRLTSIIADYAAVALEKVRLRENAPWQQAEFEQKSRSKRKRRSSSHRQSEHKNTEIKEGIAGQGTGTSEPQAPEVAVEGISPLKRPAYRLRPQRSGSADPPAALEEKHESPDARSETGGEEVTRPFTDFIEEFRQSETDFEEFLQSELERAGAEASGPQASEVAIEDLPPLEYSELQAANRRRRRRRRSGSTDPTAATPNNKTHTATQPMTPDQPGAHAQTSTASSSPVISDISDKMKEQMNYTLEVAYPALFLGPDFTIHAANLLAFWLFDTADPSNPAFDKPSLLGRKVVEVCHRKEFVNRILPVGEDMYSAAKLIEILKNFAGKRDPAAATALDYVIQNIPGLHVQGPVVDKDSPCILAIKPPPQLKNGPEFFKFQLGMFPVFHDSPHTTCAGYIVTFQLLGLFDPAYRERRLLEAAPLLGDEYNRLKNLPRVLYIQWQDEQPLHGIESEMPQHLLHMEEALRTRIIGQNEAIEKISRAVRRAYPGLKDPKLPLGSFLFLGPSGVGKTELAKALAECMFGSEEALHRINMIGLDAARLVGGAHLGYVVDEAVWLTEAVRRKPYSVILLEEIEKAYPDVINMLLQILKDGEITDINGLTVDFRNTIIIMTANIGRKSLTEAASLILKQSMTNVKIDQNRYGAVKSQVLGELKNTFDPDFLKRIDEVIVFQPLYREDVYAIIELFLKGIQTKLAEHQVELSMPQATKNYIIEQSHMNDIPHVLPYLCYNIERLVEARLVEGLTDGKFHPGDLIEAIVIDNELVLQTCNPVTTVNEKSPHFAAKPDETLKLQEKLVQVEYTKEGAVIHHKPAKQRGAKSKR